jgi:hypothetical protein
MIPMTDLLSAHPCTTSAMFSFGLGIGQIGGIQLEFEPIICVQI